MYEIRPIVTFQAPIELPHCMYRLKNFHADLENVLGEKSPPPCMKKVGTFKQVEQFLKDIKSKEMAALEDRQEKLLSQLEDLKRIMQSIKSNLKLSNNNSNTSDCLKKASNISPALKVNNIPDIVINVNPCYPPYFLLFLQRLLKEEVSLNITCYLHSSVPKHTNKSEVFVNNLKKFQNNGVPSINVRLIWKKIGPNAELSISHFLIQGEANILRFLARTLDNHLNYEKNPNTEKIDYLLDLSYKLANTNMKSSRNNLLQCLNKYVTPNAKWLGGQREMTIADIAVYDSLVNFANRNELTGNLNKWFNQCEEYVK